MRRCQRLPEVTHPVDPTRPQVYPSNRMPGAIGGKPAKTRRVSRETSCVGDAVDLSNARPNGSRSVRERFSGSRPRSPRERPGFDTFPVDPRVGTTRYSFAPNPAL